MTIDVFEPVIRRVIEDVASYVDDPYDRCYPASMTLVKDLRAIGLDARVVKLKGFIGDASRLDPRWCDLIDMVKSNPEEIITHFAVVLYGQVIDLTFGQFDSAEPAIRITKESDLLQEWRVVIDV